MKMVKYCNYTILILDASWSTECRLTQLEIFTSFLVDVATLRRCHVVTLRRIYIKEGKIMIEQHLLDRNIRIHS